MAVGALIQHPGVVSFLLHQRRVRRGYRARLHRLLPARAHIRARPRLDLAAAALSARFEPCSTKSTVQEVSLAAFQTLSPLLQALLATLFTWGMTALGAATVFLTRQVSRSLLNAMLGFAAGVMIAASFWSLLAPAIEMSARAGPSARWFPAVVGFLLGGLFLWVVDRILPTCTWGCRIEEAEGIKTTWQRSVLLVAGDHAAQLPGRAGGGRGVRRGGRGSACGHAGGRDRTDDRHRPAELPGGPGCVDAAAPEGLSRSKSFLYGQASGLVEPIAGVLGAAAVLLMRPLLPYALSFAAGAMIYVVVEELIPESQQGTEHPHVHHRRDAGLCGHDDAGCGAGVRG